VAEPEMKRKEDILFTLECEEPNSLKVLGESFYYGEDLFTVISVNRVWGFVPCFLANISAKNGQGTLKHFLLRCVSNMHSRAESDRWILTIHLK